MPFPYAPCREYLPTFPLECGHFSPNVGKYSLHGASYHWICFLSFRIPFFFVPFFCSLVHFCAGKPFMKGWAPLLDSYDIIVTVAPGWPVSQLPYKALRFPLNVYEVLNEMKGGKFFSHPGTQLEHTHQNGFIAKFWGQNKNLWNFRLDWVGRPCSQIPVPAEKVAGQIALWGTSCHSAVALRMNLRRMFLHTQTSLVGGFNPPTWKKYVHVKVGIISTILKGGKIKKSLKPSPSIS